MGAVVSEVSWGNIVKTDTNVKCGNMKQPLTRIQRILTGSWQTKLSLRSRTAKVLIKAHLSHKMATATIVQKE